MATAVAAAEIHIGREKDGWDRCDICGGDGGGINNQEIEDENYYNNNEDNKNSGDGDDKEGYGRSDEDKIRDDGEEYEDHVKGRSALTKFGEEEEGLEEEALGGRR